MSGQGETRIVLTAFRPGQITISAIDDTGYGDGFRICGPKMYGQDLGRPIARRELTWDDAQEIRRYLDMIPRPEAAS